MASVAAHNQATGMRLEWHDVGTAIGSQAPGGGVVTGFSIDTRTLQSGDLFFAIRGDRDDGHAHVAQAFAAGACAAVVERAVNAAPGWPLFHVASTARALADVARFARAEWGGPVVGVTGSAGKTTSKDVIAGMLAMRLLVGKTQGNYNNHLGVPLSILRMPPDAEVAVLEMGMNHAGEIRQLADIGRPTIGVVTNIGYAHIENFDSMDGIALAKRELIESLPADGVAVLNADDPRVAGFRDVHSGCTITFGFAETADVRAEDVVLESDGVRFRVGDAEYESPMLGRHGVRNLLAGIAVGGIFGIPERDLQEAARSMRPPRMRGQRFVHNGIVILDDSYNSNPDAVKGMLDVLAETPAERRIAVLGEMLELGRWSETLHRDIGNYAAAVGVTVLVGIRGAARHMVEAAVEAGLDANAAYFFPEPREAGEFVRSIAQPGDAILWKGSRGTHVEEALAAFLR